jgi:hypothetical protein
MGPCENSPSMMPPTINRNTGRIIGFRRYILRIYLHYNPSRVMSEKEVNFPIHVA